MEGNMRRIAVVNLKGGTGKTTTSLALAVGIANRLKKGRVLFLDGDAQGNASTCLMDGATPRPPTLTEVMMDEADITEAIRPSRHPKIDIIPATTSLADCTAWLADQIGREQRLRTALQTVDDSYELAILDAPPALSLVSVNCLNAAEELLVPLEAGLYSILGVARLQETIDKIKRHLANPDLHILSLVLQRVMKNRATRELEAQLRASYGKLVCSSVIPYSADVPLAEAHFRTVLEFAPKSPAAVAFEALITEVMKHGRKKRGARRPGRIDAA
jgi:chromosome partitioning protein